MNNTFQFVRRAIHALDLQQQLFSIAALPCCQRSVGRDQGLRRKDKLPSVQAVDFEHVGGLENVQQGRSGHNRAPPKKTGRA